VQKPTGETETKGFSITGFFGELKDILFVVLIFFIFIELIKAFRK